MSNHNVIAVSIFSVIEIIFILVILLDKKSRKDVCVPFLIVSSAVIFFLSVFLPNILHKPIEDDQENQKKKKKSICISLCLNFSLLICLCLFAYFILSPDRKCKLSILTLICISIIIIAVSSILIATI